MKEHLEDYKTIFELTQDLLCDDNNKNGFYWQFRALCNDIKIHRRRQHSTSFYKIMDLIDNYLKEKYNLSDEQLFLSPSENITNILVGYAWRNELI